MRVDQYNDGKNLMEFLSLQNLMLTINDLKRIYGFKKVDIENLVRTTDFPKPVVLATNQCHYWNFKEVDDWMFNWMKKNRVDGRDFSLK